MNLIDKAAKAKKEKFLNQSIRRIDGKNWIVGDWIKHEKQLGAFVEQSTKPKRVFDRAKYNRFSDFEAQKKYEDACSEEVVCYYLHPAGVDYFYEITKTEFNYFNELG